MSPPGNSSGTSPLLSTSREREGYDGIRHGTKWWIEAWGSGPLKTWTTRSANGRPPSPADLRNADNIVFAFEHPNGHIEYRTKLGGMDF